MSFEEQFPSLRDQGGETLGQVIPFTKWMDEDTKKMVKKHCLDKQFVKNKIEEVIEKKTAEVLLQELGLELDFTEYKEKCIAFGKTIGWKFKFEDLGYKGVNFLSGIKLPIDKIKWFSRTYIDQNKDWTGELMFLKEIILRGKNGRKQ